MNSFIFKTSPIHIVLILIAAVAFVVASLSLPQKAYDSSGLKMSCGLPLNYLSVDLTSHFPAFPHTTSCMAWDYMDDPGDESIFFFLINVALLFSALYVAVVVLPRLIGKHLPVLGNGIGSHIYTTVVVAAATTVFVSSIFTVELNSLKADADNKEFTPKEAVRLVQKEHPSLASHITNQPNAETRKSIKATRGVGLWNLQFIESKSESIIWGECYAVEYSEYGFDGPNGKQVTATGSFRGDDNPAFGLDDKCQVNMY